MTTLLSPSLQKGFELVQEPLLLVKDSLKSAIPPDSVVLAQTVQQSLTSGGKYFRPVITLLSGIATQSGSNLSGSALHALVEVAAVTEMIHVATLLHDDVIDHSDLRRGKKTVRAEWGNKVSVLSGDYLLAQASVKLAKLAMPRLVSIFAHVLADLCDGEVEQMHASFTLNTSWDTYYRKTIGKTASLFSAGCESAGIIHALPEPEIQSLKAYGRNFGIAFQIVDDLLDYTATAEEMGKPVLDDLCNGLLNAPILLALESHKLTEQERNTLGAAITSLFEVTSPETIATIQDLMQRAQALEETRQLAQQYMQAARDALTFVAPGPEKAALLEMVDYVLERRN